MLPRRPSPADGLMPTGLVPGAGIEGLKGPEDYPALLAALGARGWPEADVAAVTAATCSASCIPARRKLAGEARQVSPLQRGAAVGQERWRR